MKLINNPLFDNKKEEESKIVDGFLKGNYTCRKGREINGSV